jgi:hypothetical protein
VLVDVVLMSINCTLDNANSTACIAQAQQAADIAFASSLATNAAIAGAVLLVFVIVRRWGPLCVRAHEHGRPRWPRHECHASRAGSVWLVSQHVARERSRDCAQKRPRRVTVLEAAEIPLFVTLAFGAYGWSVLFALHALGGQTLSGTAMLSMGNVAEASNFLVANMIGVVFNSAVASVAFYVLWRRFYRWRTRYKKTAMRVENFTVLLREVDDFLTENDIRETFERIFGAGKVSERVRWRGCIC